MRKTLSRGDASTTTSPAETQAQSHAEGVWARTRPGGDEPAAPAVGTRPAEPGSDSRSAAERLAAEQELAALRRALGDKERTLDSIALECQRLEDVIEDEHSAAEGLRRDLVHQESALAAERQAVVTLTQERNALRRRLLELGADPVPGVDLGHRRAGGGLERVGSMLPFLSGIWVGIVITLIVGFAYLYLDRPAGPRDSPPRVSQPASPAPLAAEEEVAVGEAQAQPEDAGTTQVAGPAKPRTLRDRLADGSAAPTMIVLPGSSFLMGGHSPSGEPDEHPEHQVQVRGFLIGANEVTFADYDRFARAAGRRLPDDFGWGRGRRPVVDVSWVDAQAYAQWLSRQTGRRYRLPSEAEWEYAARGGTQSSYWWGGGPQPGRALCFNCGSTWDGRSTAPVGSFEPNPYGLYDTAGNVLEWTADCYRPSYEGAPADGSAWDQAPCDGRVARGGAFDKPAKSLRSTARAQLGPDTRLNMLGFRVARDE